jgi:hypothetical protein
MMTYVSNDLPVAEQRVRDLKAKIALRISQQGLATEGSTYGRMPSHVQSLYDELAKAAAVVVSMKYNPLEVIERMSAPPRAPTPAPTPPQVIHVPASDEDVRAKVREFLKLVPDTASVQSLKELIANG